MKKTITQTKNKTNKKQHNTAGILTSHKCASHNHLGGLCKVLEFSCWYSYIVLGFDPEYKSTPNSRLHGGKHTTRFEYLHSVSSPKEVSKGLGGNTTMKLGWVRWCVSACEETKINPL